MVTTSDCGTPALLYRVDSPVPLSETHHGPEGLIDSPHGFTRWASMLAAAAGISDVKFVMFTFWAEAGKLIRASKASTPMKLSREAVCGFVVLSMVSPHY